MSPDKINSYELKSGLLEHPQVAALLEGHLQHMRKHSPAESVHALAAAGLDADDISFWSLWENETVLGCVALRELSPEHGELKSMKTCPSHVGRGVATTLLAHVMQTSAQRGYQWLSLETGSGPAFEPAHQLYLKSGFQYCKPFADYSENPFSRFMTIAIDP